MPPPFANAGPLGLTTRPCTDDDLPFLAALYASTRAEEVGATAWPEQIQRGFLMQQHEAQHSHYRRAYPGAEWLIVVHGDEAVGRLYVWQNDGDVRIVDISLVPAARGKGWGGALLRDVQADAAARGLSVSIHVEYMNPARRLYDRLGFVEIEDKGIYKLLRWAPQAQDD
jgi:ribosomal protein S18 acetylase RimI-like enzyme